VTALYIVGDVFAKVAELRRRRVRVALALCSPPFLALRSYLPDGHPLKASEIGSEATPAAFIDVMLALVAALAHVLEPWGSIAFELGDTYAGSGGAGGDYDLDGLRAGQPGFGGSAKTRRTAGDYPVRDDNPRPSRSGRTRADGNGKVFRGDQRQDDKQGTGWPEDKSLAGIPEAFMLSLAYGYNVLDRRGPDSPAGRWRVRNFKPWIRCLDIDTAVYVRTPTGDRPMRLLHLDQQFASGKFEVWTGERWTPVVGTQQSRTADALEFEFRTGERVACTRDHRWPVESIMGTTKVLRADELTVGDVVPQVRLPESNHPDAPMMGDDIAWLAGVFLGDGSFDSRDRIQIAGHRTKDVARAERLAQIAADYDGTCSVYEHGNIDGGNRQNVVIRSQVLAAAIRRYVGGEGSRGKHLTVSAWRRSDRWLRSLLDGYLVSDGHYDALNDRWRLGFCDNPWLARDLRTVAARLGALCIVRRWGPVVPDARGGHWAGSTSFRYRGEIRFGHRGTDGRSQPKPRGEIVAIRATKRTTFIDVAVADDPHLFALASGLLTHNSNPPVGALGDKERPATSYITVATRDAARYFDLDSVRTPDARAAHEARPGSKAEAADNSLSYGAARGNYHANGGAPPRDWWHHVDAVLDACLDDMAGKPVSNRMTAKGVDRQPVTGKTGAAGRGGNWSDMDRVDPVNPPTGARGVHLRRALERAGILATVDAIDCSPKGYRGAHYAVWPPELVKQLVLEMAPRRVCTTCGQPSRRIVETQRLLDGEPADLPAISDTERAGEGASGVGHWRKTTERTTAGWSDCGHGSYVPGRVLDPFVGSGTTLAVCSGLGRDSIGIDLDYTNVGLAMERVGMWLEVEWPEPDLSLPALGAGSPHRSSYDRWARLTGDVWHLWGSDDEPAAQSVRLAGDDDQPLPAAKPSKRRAVPVSAGQSALF
jgi:hypothetical protein